AIECLSWLNDECARFTTNKYGLSNAGSVSNHLEWFD
ncbi:hypothetical protein A5800_001847, partial [Enterococcus sp. 5B7_DIV0075]